MCQQPTVSQPLLHSFLTPRSIMSGEKEAKKQALIAKESYKLENEGRVLREKQKRVADLKKERTMSIAFGEGMKWGTLASAFVGASTYGMSQYNAKFNKFMSISAKVSLPIMAGLFAFGLNVELKMHDVHRFPEVSYLLLSFHLPRYM